MQMSLLSFGSKVPKICYFNSSVGASASVQGRLNMFGLDQNQRPRKKRAIDTKPGAVGKFRDHPYIMSAY